MEEEVQRSYRVCAHQRIREELGLNEWSGAEEQHTLLGPTQPSVTGVYSLHTHTHSSKVVFAASKVTSVAFQIFI